MFIEIIFPKNIFHFRCNWKQTWKSCKLPWENWRHTGSSQSYSINCWWNWCHPSGNQRYVCWWKLFDSPKLYKQIVYDIGTQNDLDQKLEEIVCSIGFNTSVMPAEVVTTSPISKNFNFRLWNNFNLSNWSSFFRKRCTSWKPKKFLPLQSVLPGSVWRCFGWS